MLVKGLVKITVTWRACVTSATMENGKVTCVAIQWAWCDPLRCSILSKSSVCRPSKFSVVIFCASWVYLPDQTPEGQLRRLSRLCVRLINLIVQLVLWQLRCPVDDTLVNSAKASHFVVVRKGILRVIPPGMQKTNPSTTKETKASTWPSHSC